MPPEVVVVGAGPAGCVAAIVLARAGVRVQIVDRAQFPRHKLCGDTVNPGTMAMLSRLDAAVATRIRARALPVEGMLVTGPGRASVSADYPAGISGSAIARRELDTLLLEAAAQAGVDVATGIHVHEALGGGRVIGVRATSGGQSVTLNARLVIGADGRRSNLAFGRRLARFARQPRRWAFGAYFAGVMGLGTRGEMHIRPDGYIGVAPLPGGVANVCVVREKQHVGRTLAARRASRNGSHFDIIDDAIASDGPLRDRFAGARRVSDVTSLGPLAVEAAAAGCAGLLLAGDAAGFVDPMTGDGMRFAVRGGELAASAALRELESGAPAFEELGRERLREFGGKWRINKALRSLVASPAGIGLAARVANYWAAPVEALVSIAGDVRLTRWREYPLSGGSA